MMRIITALLVGSFALSGNLGMVSMAAPKPGPVGFAPAPPTGLVLRPIGPADSARFTISWSVNAAATGYHVRLVPSNITNAVWPADYGNALLYHQVPTRGVDTLVLAYPAKDSLGPYKVAVRACDATGCSAFATTATLTTTPFYVRARTGAAAPPVVPDSTIALIWSQPAAYGGLVGDTVRFTAQALSLSGNPMPCAFAWQSANPAVATITPAGVLAAVGAGWDTVTVSCQSVRRQAIVDFEQTALLPFTRVGIDGLGAITTTGLWPSTVQTGHYRVTFTDSTGAVVARGYLTVQKP